jgi:hypothetical protein
MGTAVGAYQENLPEVVMLDGGRDQVGRRESLERGGPKKRQEVGGAVTGETEYLRLRFELRSCYCPAALIAGEDGR